MAHVSHKLSNSLEGALAGGGDPATSPLYVFGPFLKLIVVAGVASVTFGASLWLVILTIVMVSGMYRLVMNWVTDGSGGSGLSEEEFGSWAVKINASITFIEYTLTFLVSVAALVTFVADRFPALNQSFLGIQYRTLLAIGLSILTGWLVNRGPKVAARAFGPATAAVLILLWSMVIATIWQYGLHLPAINLQAFTPEYLHYTFGGYTRILAVMTGIEIFANLVAAYDGKPREKSRKAFGSLIIIMGTTGITMLVVGPAIYALADPLNADVSVFTQTMDQILPAPLAWAGTIVGVAVLLSAAAASAQGLQNLAVGLKLRHYLPATIGRQNRFDVADKPVWIEIGIVVVCFLFFGTHEETYLAIYAAGVFILLSMTGWAATKRLLRTIKTEQGWVSWASLIGTILAATLTTAATLVIFAERFREGAWVYFLLIPGLYFIFGYFRRRLGDPTPVAERMGLLTAEKRYLPTFKPANSGEVNTAAAVQKILVPLDGSGLAEESLSVAQSLGTAYNAQVTLISVNQNTHRRSLRGSQKMFNSSDELTGYLNQISTQLALSGIKVEINIRDGDVAGSINALAREAVDMVVMSTNGRSGIQRLLIGSVANQMIQTATTPILLLRPTGDWRSRSTNFQRLLVALDGSSFAEQVLPYVKSLAHSFNSEIFLLTVPSRSDSSTFKSSLEDYMAGVADTLREEGLNVQIRVTGQGPARTIVAVSQEEFADLIMLATHGRGGFDRFMVGSVADRVIQNMPCPVFLVPVREEDRGQTKTEETENAQ
ncbi:MAG: universal stress protein [Anaerolineales bacterium]|nr:universal stress protein [Anaerolineales bacterium]